MFILNLAYGYIPYILPVYISNNLANPILLGNIKASIAIGEILGLFIIAKVSKYVSITFKISMIGNIGVMILLYFTDSIIIFLLLFLLYGIFDSLTQPLFSYIVSIIDKNNRGKILGGIDAIILLSPSIGMYLITKAMDINTMLGYSFLILIFIMGYLIIDKNKTINNITLTREEEDNI